MKPLLLIASLLLISTLQAQEYYGLEKDKKETNVDSKPIGLRLQLGLGLSRGDLFNDSSITQNYNYNDTFTQHKTASTQLELSIGYYLSDFKKGGKLLQLVLEHASPTEASRSYDYTQVGGCYEMYLGRKDFNFFFGVLISYGVVNNLVAGVDNVYYIATEPYLGMNFPLYKALSFHLKFGYEWQSFDKVHYTLGTDRYTSKLDAYNINSSLGIGYTF